MAAEERSVSRASERLFVSQPAVSRQIKDLEEELGMDLFLRKPGGLQLTEAGSIALIRAREILRQANVMAEEVNTLAARDAAAVLKVGFLPTALPEFLAEAIRRFRKQSPGIQVHIFEMTPSEQAEALARAEIDLAFIGDPTEQVKRDYHVTPIFRSAMVMLVPADHPLSGRKSVRLAEFSDDPFITLHEDHFPDRPRLMAEFFFKAKVQPEITFHARTLTELLGHVGGGAGVAIAPGALDVMPHPGVVFLPLRHPKRTLTFMAARRKGKPVEGLDLLLGYIRARKPAAASPSSHQNLE